MGTQGTKRNPERYLNLAGLTVRWKPVPITHCASMNNFECTVSVKVKTHLDVLFCWSVFSKASCIAHGEENRRGWQTVVSTLQIWSLPLVIAQMSAIFTKDCTWKLLTSPRHSLSFTSAISLATLQNLRGWDPWDASLYTRQAENPESKGA